jgi:hypothetical protein
MYGPKLHINHADHISLISNLFSPINWGVRTAHESLSSFVLGAWGLSPRALVFLNGS